MKAKFALLIALALTTAGAFDQTISTGNQWWLLLLGASCVLMIGVAVRLMAAVQASLKNSQN